MAEDKKINSKNPFEGMSLNELDSMYAVLARGNGAEHAKDWMEQIEAGVDKHIDSYKSQQSKEPEKKEEDK